MPWRTGRPPAGRHRPTLPRSRQHATSGCAPWSARSSTPVPRRAHRRPAPSRSHPTPPERPGRRPGRAGSPRNRCLAGPIAPPRPGASPDLRRHHRSPYARRPTAHSRGPEPPRRARGRPAPRATYPPTAGPVARPAPALRPVGYDVPWPPVSQAASVSTSPATRPTAPATRP